MREESVGSRAKDSTIVTWQTKVIWHSLQQQFRRFTSRVTHVNTLSYAPIYELGQFVDKRPFFAMKLVKGETLSKLLADREDVPLPSASKSNP